MKLLTGLAAAAVLLAGVAQAPSMRTIKAGIIKTRTDPECGLTHILTAH